MRRCRLSLCVLWAALVCVACDEDTLPAPVDSFRLADGGQEQPTADASAALADSAAEPVAPVADAGPSQPKEDAGSADATTASPAQDSGAVQPVADAGLPVVPTQPVTCTVAYYRDADEDGFGDPLPQASCLWMYGYVDNKADCYDKNADAWPGSTIGWSGVDRGDGSFDYNCDGKEEQQSATLAKCGGYAKAGWNADVVPKCGQIVPWYLTEIDSATGAHCTQTYKRQQLCK